MESDENTPGEAKLYLLAPDRHPETLDDGTVVAPGAPVMLTEEETGRPHTAWLLEEGVLIETKPPRESDDEGDDEGEAAELAADTTADATADATSAEGDADEQAATTTTTPPKRARQGRTDR